MVITESLGLVSILSFWIYLLKALYVSSLNFSIIPVTKDLVGSLTSKRLLLLIWGVPHSATAKNHNSLGPQGVVLKGMRPGYTSEGDLK
jgi:hypothetical protein